jgi:hypothetical protein
MARTDKVRTGTMKIIQIAEIREGPPPQGLSETGGAELFSYISHQVILMPDHGNFTI